VTGPNAQRYVGKCNRCGWRTPPRVSAARATDEVQAHTDATHPDWTIETHFDWTLDELLPGLAEDYVPAAGIPIYKPSPDEILLYVDGAWHRKTTTRL
jgi:hypothetical protein